MTFQSIWHSYYKLQLQNTSSNDERYHLWVHRNIIHWNIEYWDGTMDESKFDYTICQAVNLSWIGVAGDIYIKPFDPYEIKCTTCKSYLLTGRLKVEDL